MDKPPTWFQLDYWYKVFVVGGAAGAAAALVFEFHAIENTHAFLLFLGMFFVGIGEWINHPLQTGFLSPSPLRPAGVVTSHPRNPSLLGSLFDVLGGLLIAMALYKLHESL